MVASRYCNNSKIESIPSLAELVRNAGNSKPEGDRDKLGSSFSQPCIRFDTTADRKLTPEGEVTAILTTANDYQVVTIPLSPATVEAWLADSAQNKGVLITLEGPTGTEAVSGDFVAKERTGGYTPPELIITIGDAQTDTTPPAAIGNLAAPTSTQNSVTLT